MELLLDHPSAKPNQWGEWQARPGPADALKLELKPGFKDVPARIWIDGKDSKLEEQLTGIVINIGVAGEARYRQGEVRHHAWLIQRRHENEVEIARRKAEAERLALEQCLKAEKERRERLVGQARDWRAARDIRGFVEDVLASRRVADEDLKAWADWARAEADAMDPMLNGALAPQTYRRPASGDR